MIGPTPGTEASRSSLSRQAGEPRTASSISAVEAGEFLLERLDQTGDALLDARGGPLLALALGADHLDDLPPPGNQIGQQPRGFVGQGPRLGPGRLGEVGDDGGIDRIGLGTLADRLGEGADLGRIDDDDRQPCSRQRRRRDGLEAAGGFQSDERGSQRLEPFTSSSRPPALRSTANTSPLGRTATSRRSLATSMPTTCCPWRPVLA